MLKKEKWKVKVVFARQWLASPFVEIDKSFSLQNINWHSDWVDEWMTRQDNHRIFLRKKPLAFKIENYSSDNSDFGLHWLVVPRISQQRKQFPYKNRAHFGHNDSNSMGSALWIVQIRPTVRKANKSLNKGKKRNILLTGLGLCWTVRAITLYGV